MWYEIACYCLSSNAPHKIDAIWWIIRAMSQKCLEQAGQHKWILHSWKIFFVWTFLFLFIPFCSFSSTISLTMWKDWIIFMSCCLFCSLLELFSPFSYFWNLSTSLGIFFPFCGSHSEVIHVAFSKCIVYVFFLFDTDCQMDSN